MEKLNDNEYINRTWKNIKENINTTTKEYELKQHEPWSDGEYLLFLDKRKQAKLQWLQDPNQSNVEILSDLRRKASRCFRNKKTEYLKAKTDKLETNSNFQKHHTLEKVYHWL